MIYVPLEYSEDEVINHLMNMAELAKLAERSVHSRITNSASTCHGDFFLKKIEERIKYLDSKKEKCQQ